MLLPALAISNVLPPKGKLLRLPKVASFSVLAFKSVVSAVKVDGTVETEFDKAAGVDPNFTIGAAGNEGAGEVVETLTFEADHVLVSW